MGSQRRPYVNERYSHRFHAGNVGDVWKHTVLVTLLQTLSRRPGGLTVVDTHAGAARYELGPTGEWTEGIGKLWAAAPTAPLAVQRYLELEPAPRPGERRMYQGSPLLALALLGPEDRLVVCELEPDTSASLREAVGGDPRARVCEGDGLAALPVLLEELPRDAEVLVVIDPCYGSKEEWNEVPQALIDTYRARPTTRMLLWYPVKSYTRPNVLLQKLGASGMPTMTMELITTPLELQKNRLNGNGVLLVNAPDEALSDLFAAAPVLGRIGATHAGRFTCRSVGWSAPWSK